MVPAILIAKKREGFELSADEISWFVSGFSKGDIPDYQMSAMAMAICLRGMNPNEIACLTQTMLDSGEQLPRESGEVPRVDKHSTGGLGDKISLVLAPLLACCGVSVPMISGRGLGLSGGTLDKLEAIDGFDCDLSLEQSSRLLKDVGCHIVSASETLAPADRKLYALRDVTGTVESVALITASILSKKLAASLDSLVMDVKVGSGAFMNTLEDASKLSRSLVETGKRLGLPVTALITDMDQPLGQAVGNAIEVNESIDVLQGGGPRSVRDLTIRLCAEPLVSTGICDSYASATELLVKKLDDGSAMERFEKLIAGQKGKLAGKLPIAKKHAIVAARSGSVSSIDCRLLGQCIVALGGGRQKKHDVIDPAVGIDVMVEIADQVSEGEELAFLYCEPSAAERWCSQIQSAFEIVDHGVLPRELVIQKMEPIA